ncbi:hypothetical protein Tco_0775075 [Tanacetum coccineum]
MENITEESAGKPLSNTVSGTSKTENHLEKVAKSADSAVRSAHIKGKDYKDKKKQKQSKTDKEMRKRKRQEQE